MTAAPSTPGTSVDATKFPSGAKVVRVKRTGSGYGLLVALGTGFSVGLMPAAALNANFTLGWRTPSAFGIELTGVLLPFGRTPTSDGNVDFRAGYAELRGCVPLARKPPVHVDTCLGLWNGVMRARARGFDVDNLTRTGPLSGATFQVRAAWDFLERYFVRGAAGLGVPFVRDRFTVLGTDDTRVVLHRISPVSGVFGLEFGMQFR